MMSIDANTWFIAGSSRGLEKHLNYPVINSLLQLAENPSLRYARRTLTKTSTQD